MGNQWEAHAATITFGKPVTRKTVDVSNRVYRVEQLAREK